MGDGVLRRGKAAVAKARVGFLQEQRYHVRFKSRPEDQVVVAIHLVHQRRKLHVGVAEHKKPNNTNTNTTKSKTQVIKIREIMLRPI
jgi:hypothetical protein